MLASRFRVASQLRRSVVTRSVTTLSNNPDIVGSVVSCSLAFLTAGPTAMLNTSHELQEVISLFLFNLFLISHFSTPFAVII